MSASDNILEAGKNIVQSITQNLVQFLEILFQKVRDRKNTYRDDINNGILALAEHQAKGGKILSHTCIDTSEAEYLKQIARRHHIPVQLITARDNDGNLSSILCYRDKDKYRIQKIMEDFRELISRSMTEIPIQQFIDEYVQKDVHKIIGVSVAEVEAFREQAAGKEIPFSISKAEDGTYVIWAPQEFEKSIDEILKKAVMDATVPTNKVAYEKYHEDKRKIINLSFSEEPLFIADGLHPNHGYIIEKGNMTEITIRHGMGINNLVKGKKMSITGRELEQKVMMMHNPVIMSAKDNPFISITPDGIILSSIGLDHENFEENYERFEEKVKNMESLNLIGPKHEKVISYDLRMEDSKMIDKMLIENPEMEKTVVIKDGWLAVKESNLNYVKAVINKNLYNNMSDGQKLNTMLRIEDRLSSGIKEMDISDFKNLSEPIIITDAKNHDLRQNMIEIDKNSIEWIYNGEVQKKITSDEMPIETIALQMTQAFEEPIAMTKEESMNSNIQEYMREMMPSYKHSQEPSGAEIELRQGIPIPLEETRYSRIKKENITLGKEGKYRLNIQNIDMAQEEIHRREKKKGMGI